jgi:hypothetical protein
LQWRAAHRELVRARTRLYLQESRARQKLQLQQPHQQAESALEQRKPQVEMAKQKQVAEKLALKDTPLCSETAPVDWTDRKTWDRYLHGTYYQGPFALPTEAGARGWQPVGFLDLEKEHSDRIWFPGCGTDIAPRFYSCLGCGVMATDFSPIAIKAQRAFAAVPPHPLFTNWSSLMQQTSVSFGGWDSCRLTVAEQDFTIAAPEGAFDVALNCRAFRGLSAESKPDDRQRDRGASLSYRWQIKSRLGRNSRTSRLPSKLAPELPRNFICDPYLR